LKKSLGDLAFGIMVFTVLPVAPAHAYLDGATASIVLQAAAGAIASALLFGKMYWARLTGLFKRSKTDPRD
jgi:hypothetical protein